MHLKVQLGGESQLLSLHTERCDVFYDGSYC